MCGRCGFLIFVIYIVVFFPAEPFISGEVQLCDSSLMYESNCPILYISETIAADKVLPIHSGANIP